MWKTIKNTILGLLIGVPVAVGAYIASLGLDFLYCFCTCDPEFCWDGDHVIEPMFKDENILTVVMIIIIACGIIGFIMGLSGALSEKNQSDSARYVNNHAEVKKSTQDIAAKNRNLISLESNAVPKINSLHGKNKNDADRLLAEYKKDIESLEQKSVFRTHDE